MPTPIVLKLLALLLLLLPLGNQGFAQKQKAPLPAPDFANVPYGPHERNVLDLWIADSVNATPLAIYIHGGGFVAGSKNGLNPKVLKPLLDAGISVAALNYRFIRQAPLPAAHQDVLRALQFIRSKAGAWKIDKDRIGAFGGSAGAQLCMWLAFSDEMADPEAEDPIARESSRLLCVATNGGQTTMDLDLWREWVPGFVEYRTPQEEFYGTPDLEVHRAVINKISALALISDDDPPIFMHYGMAPDEAIPEKKAQSWKVHHVIFGVKLKEKMDKLGVEADLSYPGAETRYESRLEFLKAKLL